MEGVDRNIQFFCRTRGAISVTLRMEGVDRNVAVLIKALAPSVTLRMEGVDRNTCYLQTTLERIMSPSAWRVWIEISTVYSASGFVRGHPPHGGCG